ncbi:hypothetical protein [Prosthecomicrobium sp. N25]|uniref:hypothetical protein n=1 Tax=Prosthecomicrobium sp. N25 TaxID=3129254 RepID=UPI00307819E5
MSDDDHLPPPTVVRLDTRQADLGRDLRRLFEPVLDEPVPPDLARLADFLEAKLAEPADGFRSPHPNRTPPDAD